MKHDNRLYSTGMDSLSEAALGPPEKTMAEIISHFSAAVDALADAIKCSQVTDSRRQRYIDTARAEVEAINS